MQTFPGRLRGLALVSAIGCGIAGVTACGSGGAATPPAVQTITVTSVACDGSIATTTTAAPQSSGGSSGGAFGHPVTPQIGGGLATPTPAPTPRVIRGGAVQLTSADGGSTIVVPVGTSIAVQLGPAAAPFCWSAPTSSDQRIIEQLTSSSGNDRAGRGSFRARTLGSAALEASMDPRCSPPCGAASMQWRVQVEVTA